MDVSAHICGLRLKFEEQQATRTLLSISADLDNTLVWMVSAHPLISKSLNQFFGDYTECTNYNWYHRHLHVFFVFFFCPPLRSWYLSIFSLSFKFANTTKSNIQQVLFFLLFFFFFFFFDYHLVWLSGQD